MAARVIGRLDQIPPGEGRNFTVDGVCLAVFHTRAGAVFATQPSCPHRGGPLADGLVGGTTLLCPLHERGFDLTTGAGLGNDDRLVTYDIALSDDGMLILR